MKRFNIPILLIFLFLFSGYLSSASEVDNFSSANKKYLDATVMTNNLINIYLHQLAEKTTTCDRQTLLTNARYLMDTNFPRINKDLVKLIYSELPAFDPTKGEVMSHPALQPKKELKGSETVHAESTETINSPKQAETVDATSEKKSAEPSIKILSPEEQEHYLRAHNSLTSPRKIYVGFQAPRYRGCCSSVVEVAGTKMGIDKIDHFLSNGFFLFLEHTTDRTPPNNGGEDAWPPPEPVIRTEEQRKKDALKFNTFSEEASWGLSGTGIKSYGDMAANYQGYQFYKELIDGNNPYLKCKDGKWTQNREFNITNYADDSWNEAINCSSFNSEENRDIVFKNMKAMGIESCPISPESCAALTKKYGEDGKNFLHPKCRDPQSKHTFVEKAQSNLGEVMKFIEFKDLINGAKGAM